MGVVNYWKGQIKKLKKNPATAQQTARAKTQGFSTYLSYLEGQRDKRITETTARDERRAAEATIKQDPERIIHTTEGKTTARELTLIKVVSSCIAFVSSLMLLLLSTKR